MPKRILIVDDEPDFVTVTQRRLSEQGYDVLVAGSGKEGIAKAQQDQPDVILLDIIMQDIPGNMVADALRQNPSTRAIPVIFLTSLVEAREIKEKGHMIGGQCFIAKASSTAELVALISKVLQKPA
jgi:CheY-like chemotaxis protein